MYSKRRLERGVFYLVKCVDASLRLVNAIINIKRHSLLTKYESCASIETLEKRMANTPFISSKSFKKFNCSRRALP